MSASKRLVLGGVALTSLLLGAGCAAPGPRGPDGSVPELPQRASTPSIAADALRRAEELYLYPEHLDRRVMIGALDALEDRFDSVRFEVDEPSDYGTLTVGLSSARVPLDEQLHPDDFERVLGRALHFAARELGDEVDSEEDSDLELIALRGALGALDGYSTVFSGRGTEDFQIRFSGKLKGIGARIGRRDGQLIAVRVFSDSPAKRAGLEDGDAILYVDGSPTQPLTVSEAVGQIRGKEGTPVVLTILRLDEQLEIEIVRGEVVVPSVEARTLADGLGYAHIDTVSRSTVEEFKAKVLELGPLTGLVLDLRGNTGGSMKAAADLADFFLEQGVIVRIVDRDGDGLGRRRRALARPGILLGAQVVILVDPATASAAEILSGALAPLPRVTIVGQTTFGKGLIQQVMRLPRQTLLKLTIGEYLLSEDRAIHELGIEPDIALYPVSTENLGRLAQVPQGALPYLRRPGEDDTFPVELAQELLTHSRREALERTRERTEADIRAALSPFQVSWPGDSALPAEGDRQSLLLSVESTLLVGGETARVRVSVDNPNPFAIPDAWAALQGPAKYLANRIVALGTIPAGGSASGEIEFTPNDGLSVDPLLGRVLVAAGVQPLQEGRTALHVEQKPPQLEIEVVRLSDERVSITLQNRGCCHPGQVTVAVRGAVRAFETLAPDDPETVELPLSGSVEAVTVLLSGAGVQRRIEIPIPDESVRVVPPALELERAYSLGRGRVEARAESPEGLQEGWLALDGQKEMYLAWDGSPAGLLSADLGEGEQSVMTKIETTSGVSVIDVRQLRAD